MVKFPMKCCDPADKTCRGESARTKPPSLPVGLCREVKITRPAKWAVKAFHWENNINLIPDNRTREVMLYFYTHTMPFQCILSVVQLYIINNKIKIIMLQKSVMLLASPNRIANKITWKCGFLSISPCYWLNKQIVPPQINAIGCSDRLFFSCLCTSCWYKMYFTLKIYTIQL